MKILKYKNQQYFSIARFFTYFKNKLFFLSFMNFEINVILKYPCTNYTNWQKLIVKTIHLTEIFSQPVNQFE